MPSQFKRVRALSESRFFNKMSRGYMATKVAYPTHEKQKHVSPLKRSIRPVRNEIKEIFKIIHLKKEEGKQLDEFDLETLAWFKERRLQDEAWKAQHIPVRDLVFSEHYRTSARAKSSSIQATAALHKCEWTQQQYREMNDDY